MSEFSGSQDDERLLDDEPVLSVTLDALALAKIIDHCNDSLPNLATGQLLGSDFAGELEVSNTFPFPIDSADDSSASADAAEYQSTMLRCFGDMNLDSQAVGWYQSTYMGSFVNMAMIDTQFDYQQNIKQSVVIVYDPLRSRRGSLALKAYRLSDKFMELYKEKKFNMESLRENEFSFGLVFEELPIKIHRSSLAAALMTELQEDSQSEAMRFGGLTVASDVYLEKNVELLNDCFDALSQDQYKWNRYQQQVFRQQQALHHQLQRRRVENQKRQDQGKPVLPEEDILASFKPIQEPSRLDLLLLDNQISQYCEQIDQFAGSAVTKLYGCRDIVANQ